MFAGGGRVVEFGVVVGGICREGVGAGGALGVSGEVGGCCAVVALPGVVQIAVT